MASNRNLNNLSDYKTSNEKCWVKCMPSESISNACMADLFHNSRITGEINC